MSNLFNTPWTTSEKVTLLNNVLQGAYPDLPSVLYNIISERSITPRWNEIALPEGRSLAACQFMFEEIARTAHQTPHFPTVTGLPYSTTSIPSNLPQIRPLPEQEPIQSMRAIQPRPPRSTDSPAPPITNGESFSIIRTYGNDMGSVGRRKRGRPTKEEAQERDRAFAAEGKVYERKRRPVKRFRASTGTPGLVADAPLPASPSFQTPSSQTIQPKEDSSSGKRRTRRQEAQSALTQIETVSPISVSDPSTNYNPAHSPSDRLLARQSDRDLQATTTSLQPDQPSITVIPSNTSETGS